MTEFMAPSEKVNQAVIDATTGKDASFEGMREQMKAALVREGRIERDAESLGYAVRALPGQTANVPVAAAQPANPVDAEGNELLCRSVTVGKETRLLTAYSVTGLDILEAGFRRSH